MTIGDYVLCYECGVKLIYDKPAYTYKLYTNREWWKDRFGKELKMICPVCRKKNVEELVSALKTAHCWTSREIHTQHTAPLIEGALSKLEDILEDKE